MDKGTLLALLEKFRQGECTPEEEALLSEWLDALERDNDVPELSALEMQQIKKNMQQQIWPDPAIRRRRIGLRIVRIAAVVVPLIIGGYFAQQYLQHPSRQLPHSSLDWQTVKNTSGQLQKIVLPDNTVALLGPYSTIQYPEHFPDNARPVKLTEGKAFFDVIKDTRPFSVEDYSGVRTTVLGTSFTIEASNTLHISRVAVATGKVQVERQGTKPATLGPSERLTFSEQSVKQDSVAANDLLAWTKGEIILRNATLQDLLLTIKNQYGITATTALDVHQGNYTLHIPATMTLQEVLDIIEKISYRPKIHFSMQHEQLQVN
ncbi:FecR family protein [Chitinophaga sp. CF418]|uniref:FecR family protein n=1 Tax=Chitinophaga sp. CF418 TaxID=1855287 RepID=UPI0009164B6A|nr:FecR family protein [Chitinophaga sp. CF418]SHM22865.1 FecR family protein [Chitinophaga sp. CF418]